MSDNTATETPAAPAVALEIVENKELIAAATKHHVSSETAIQLATPFAPIVKELTGLLEQAARVEVTDATQVTQIRHARELRLQLRKKRVEAEVVKTDLKADSLQRGKAIDGLFAWIRSKVEPVEEKLLAAEQFAERAEAKRLADRKAARIEALKPYPVDAQFYDLANMPDPAFDKLLLGIKEAHEKELAAKAKAEADRIAKEQADAAERERIKQENERLKKEAEEREAAAKAEREQLAAEKKEADERAAAAAAKAKQEAEAAEKKRLADLEAKEKEAKDRVEKALEEQRRANAEAARIEREQREALEKEEQRKLAEARKKMDADLAEAKRKSDEEKAARKRAEEDYARAVKAEADRQAAEQKKQEEEAARIRALRAAPDKDKIAAVVARIRDIELPELATADAKALAKTFAAQREKFAAWLERETAKLGTAETQTQLPGA